jgi:hypothetical protein
MAGAMALLSTFATRDELSLDLHRTSAVSGSIASATVPIVSGTSRGLPFICGLLCEVGALACLVVDGPGYVEVWQRTVTVTGRWSPSAPKARDDLETKRYGATTRTIGARLLRRHRLPDVIANVLEATPWQTPDAPLLHRAVAFARVATPLVAAAQAGQTKIALTEQLAAVARWISLGELAPEELARRCIAAANIAERSVRAVRG